MTFAVRQTVAGGALRTVHAGDDEELARIAYALSARAARAGVYTELCADDEVIDCTTSEGARRFKVAGRAPRQASLF